MSAYPKPASSTRGSSQNTGPAVTPPRRRVLRWRTSGTDEALHRDRWLVSYADFMTLLFAFFVVMYAISSVNDEKYRVLGATLEAVFALPLSRQQGSVGAAADTVGIRDGGNVVLSVLDEASELERGNQYQATEPTPLRENLKGFIEDRVVDVAANDEWLEISLNGDIGFESGSARLTLAAQQALRSIAEFAAGTGAPITVEGYADSATADATSSANWLLSGARAAGVAAALETNGIKRQRLSAVGYGENHPLRSNATPAGRAANRRVVIVLARAGNVARNLNATDFQRTPFGSSFAFVRQTDPQRSAKPLEPIRTGAGGLLFSNEP